MKLRVATLLTCAAFATVCSPLASTAGAATPTPAGTWSCCGAGGAGEQTFEITVSGGSLSGTALQGGTPFAPISGSTSGTSVTIVTGPYTSLPSYTATFVGTLAANGDSMSGTWSSTASQSGTWTATRVSGAGLVTTPKEEEEAALKADEEKALAEEEAADDPSNETCEKAQEAPDDEATDDASDARVALASPFAHVAEASPPFVGPIQPTPPPTVPPGFIKVGGKGCPIVPRPTEPIDPEKDARKAEDAGYGESLGDAAATDAIKTAAYGVVAAAPTPIAPVGQVYAVASGIATATEAWVGRQAEKRGKDPATFNFTAIPRVKDPHVPLPSAARHLAASLRKLTLATIDEGETVIALSAAADQSIDRAAGANAKHKKKWERRQMLALAGFATRLAGALDTYSSDLSKFAASIGAKLSSQTITGAEIDSYAASAKHGLPAALSKILGECGVPAAEQTLLAWRMSTAKATAGTSISAGALGTQAAAGTVKLLREYAVNLRAYAARIRRHPVAGESG